MRMRWRKQSGAGLVFRRRLGWLLAVLAVTHVVALAMFAVACAAGAPPLGLGALAYFFGLRHAFDVDHIAAIDNVTRKLRNNGQRPVFTGFMFSLGHSTVVVALSLALVVTLRHTRATIGALNAWGGLAGTVVSAAFLTLIGVVNALVLVQLMRTRRRLNRGHAGPAVGADVDALLDRRGLIARGLRCFYRRLDASWKMYPLGVLFGLGFDTATEIAVLGLSAVAAQNARVPLWVVMVFPLLFTAAMTLTDSLDGLLMLRAYDWAMGDRARKLSFNLVVTGLSVFTALAIGALEWGQVVGRLLDLHGPLWTLPTWGNFGSLGLGATLLMLAAWGLALIIYHRRRGPAP